MPSSPGSMLSLLRTMHTYPLRHTCCPDGCRHLPHKLRGRHYQASASQQECTVSHRTADHPTSCIMLTLLAFLKGSDANLLEVKTFTASFETSRNQKAPHPDSRQLLNTVDLPSAVTRFELFCHGTPRAVQHVFSVAYCGMVKAESEPVKTSQSL